MKEGVTGKWSQEREKHVGIKNFIDEETETQRGT